MRPHAPDLVQTAPVPAVYLAPGSLALFPFHPEPARRRGIARRTRHRRHVRNHPLLDDQVRHGDRSQDPPRPPEGRQHLAHLDEMVVRIRGQRMYMWRAVDSEGEELDVLVQKRRKKATALKLLRKLLKNQGFVPNGSLQTASLLTGRPESIGVPNPA